MKKKIIIASIFATILMLVPATSAFQMPMTTNDKEELKREIDEETQDVQEILNGIITAEGALNIDELECIYEEYILTGDDSVLNSDPWDWVLERLGWVYLTMEQVIEIYNTGMNLYNRLNQGIQIVQNWYDSIVAFRSAWQAFKENPVNFQTIVDLINGAINLLEKTLDLIDYVGSESLQNALTAFSNSVTDFINFIQSNPWAQPITITGELTNFDGSVTVSVPGDSATEEDSYELSFQTSGANMPWFVHKVTVNAEYETKSTSNSAYAFSMGTIEMDFARSDFKALEKNTMTHQYRIIEALQTLFNGIFKNIIYKIQALN